MFEHIVEQQQPINATLLELKKAELFPNEAEISTMQVFMNVLKPIVEITDVTGAKN